MYSTDLTTVTGSPFLTAGLNLMPFAALMARLSKPSQPDAITISAKVTFAVLSKVTLSLVNPEDCRQSPISARGLLFISKGLSFSCD